MKRLLPFLLLVLGSCVVVPPPDDNDNEGDFNNTTDPTNRGASFVGAAACGSCHADIAAQHILHAHAHTLTRIQGLPPEFPPEAERAGVPTPPEGLDWSDIAYVVGGYTRFARFVDLGGFVLTTGESGMPTQWSLGSPANGTSPGFMDYEADRTTPLPFEPAMFQRISTGPRGFDAMVPQTQDNRPGIAGTWMEPGVQCEACHGPGSNHLPMPSARDLFVGNSAANCGSCHSRDGNPAVIHASGGYLEGGQSWPELLASGGHANFSCTTCHDPHAGTSYGGAGALRNGCTACHADQNMAIHEGFTFIRGNYVEPVTCQSCHMPFAASVVTTAGAEVVGGMGRMGDSRTHVFRINTAPVDFRAMFSGDGSAVVKDAQGRAAVTLDFVCFRCHNDVGNAGTIDRLDLAAGVASNMHAIVRPE